MIAFPFLLVSCNNPGIKTSSGEVRPNIVFIFSDDLSFRDVGAYGQKNYSTPNIDSLAAISTRFTRAYAAAPECAPSRASLLTGLHVGHQPIRLNSSARGFEPLPADTYTLAEMLHEAGYRTGVIGKWGLGYKDTEGQPLNQGFDYHFGYLTHYEAHSYFPLVLYENNREIPFGSNEALNMELLYEDRDGQLKETFEGFYDREGKLIYMDPGSAVYAPDLLDAKAAEFIERNSGGPFFLWFTTNLPHGPTIVDDLRQLSGRADMDLGSREWGAMVQRLDISVGRIMEKLREEGIFDRTMIVFASDNGYAMHGPHTDASGRRYWSDDPFLENKGPFRGGKFSVLEGGMRIPFFIRLPGQTEPKIVSEPVWLVDLFPTFVSLAGAEVNVPLDGYNLLPLIQGDRNAIPADRFMYFFKQNEQAIIQGPWFAFREHPDSTLELYLVEEDQVTAYDYASLYPQKALELVRLMDSIHTPSRWYWNPGDSQEDFARKVRQAKEDGIEIKRYRPNRMQKMPWEN